MRTVISRTRGATASGRIATPMRNADFQQRSISKTGSGHDPSRMRVGDARNNQSIWGVARNYVRDKPDHQFQFKNRQMIADAVAKSKTPYGEALVGPMNRSLDVTGYDLPDHMASSIAQNVTDEAEGKITQSRAHAREAMMFARHYAVEGLLGGNKEARNPIYALGAGLNTLGAVGTKFLETYGSNLEDDRPSYRD